VRGSVHTDTQGKGLGLASSTSGQLHPRELLAGEKPFESPMLQQGMVAGSTALKISPHSGNQIFKDQYMPRLVPGAAQEPVEANGGVSAQSMGGSWHLPCLGC
jgi:hypothetical protein